MPHVLEVADFTVRRADGWSIGLPAITLARGGVAALYGPSGCGKTTLLEALFGLRGHEPYTTEGQVLFQGKAFAAMTPQQQRLLRRADVAILMQGAHSALDPLQPVGRQVEQATQCSGGTVVSMLQRLGIAEAETLVRRLPHEIAGGQAQRVLLAIAFLRQPALVVADEPSASLDGGSYAEMLAHLRGLVEQGSAVLLASHDERLLRDLGAAVFALEDRNFRPALLRAAPWPALGARSESDAAPVLAARSVRVAFGARTVLEGVDFEVGRGEVVGIVGESGAGKTTLARVLTGHLRPDAGAVERPPQRSAVQLVCQDAFASLTPGRTLRELLAEATAPSFDVAAAAAALRLPLAVFDRTAAQMSGGERRRAALLRALAVQPVVLVLDEPTASLDRATAAAVVESMLVLQQSSGL
ncbi:MAG TPA: ATP-binding cassette domain-containing protein, partial [Planctomycetota bacterium]|nr:ATP-binding cassette domain-containing protein [Planctomycetota bacterium]